MIDIIAIALSLATSPPPGGDAPHIANDPALHELSRQSWQSRLIGLISPRQADAADMATDEEPSPDQFPPQPRQALNPPPTPANDALGW